jgi:tRNA nucleotidyltransferase/poly(A) polymerase
MLSLGYKQVGRHFPVFLHPVDGNEYALARTEIKSGEGHADFQFSFGLNVTLDQDAERRDFTINALFMNEDSGEFLDPTGRGFQDAENKIIRHVSKHFGEDPLRVLRACRFAAQFSGFNIAPETMELMRRMVAGNMLEHLTRERIDNEFIRAMSAGYDSRKFLENMHECGALGRLYPELHALTETIERPEFHTSGTTFGHVLCALDSALGESQPVKIAICYHDVYKAKSYADANKFRMENPGAPRGYFPHDDETAMEYLDECMSARKFPNAVTNLCRTALQYHMRMWLLFSGIHVRKWIDMLGKITHGFQIDCRNILTDLLKVCRADYLSDKPPETRDRHSAYGYDALEACALETFDACAAIRARDISRFDRLPVSALVAKLKRARIRSVRKNVAFFHF